MLQPVITGSRFYKFRLRQGCQYGIMYPKLSLTALDTDKFSLSAIPAGLLPHGGTGTTCRKVGGFMI